MSSATLETVLYDLGTKGSARKGFKQDAKAFLEKYPLTQSERDMIEGFDVKGLADAGANPMLTMGLWLSFRGPQELPKYIAAMAGKPTKAGD